MPIDFLSPTEITSIHLSTRISRAYIPAGYNKHTEHNKLWGFFIQGLNNSPSCPYCPLSDTSFMEIISSQGWSDHNQEWGHSLIFRHSPPSFNGIACRTATGSTDLSQSHPQSKDLNLAASLLCKNWVYLDLTTQELGFH